MWEKIEPKINPQLGDKRVETKFAWLPKVTSDGYKIWLEYYISYSEYRKFKILTAMTGYLRWVTEWVEVRSEFTRFM
jgi:hypothetical protein